MPKATTQFVCSECGYTSPKWLGRCPDCGKFNTLIEETIAPPTPAAKKTAAASGSAKATPLRDVTYEKYERISSGIAELDVVLGGGIVRGSLVLVGGDPGVGKSTLLTQVAAHLAKEHRVLYLSAEESCSQVKLRCERLGVNAGGLMLMNETNLENAEEEISTPNTSSSTPSRRYTRARSPRRRAAWDRCANAPQSSCASQNRRASPSLSWGM